MSLTISPDSLLRLPAGAVYAKRSGRARVSVGKDVGSDGRETIVVYASCDSLERLCGYYERRLGSLRRDSVRASEALKRKEVEHRPNGVGTLLKWFLIGIIAGGLTRCLITKLRN